MRTAGSILTVILSSLLLQACGGEHSRPAKSELASLKVRTAGTLQDPISTVEEIPGLVRPKTEATIEAKVQGRIETLSVREGDIVKEGTPLLLLSAPELQARVSQAQAELDEAQRNLKRLKALVERNAVTRQDYDSAVARAKVAEGGAQEAQTMLSYTKLAAPFAGVVTKRFIDVGDLAAPGKPLLQIERQDHYRFECDVPETLLPVIRETPGDAPKKTFAVRLGGLGELQGTVSEINPATDPNSRTVNVKFDLPASPDLRSGQYGRVLLPLRNSKQLRVPRDAVLERGQLELVFVVSEDKAQLRIVRTGREFADSVEILSGLNGDEQVVVGPEVSAVLDGQPVEVMQ